MSSPVRHFARVPLDFDNAFKSGLMTPFAYALGCHLVAESWRTTNTDGGVVTAFISALAEMFDVTPPTIRRTLRALEAAGWIDCGAVEERQRTPWRIRLTRLSMDVDCDPTASPEPPAVTQSSERVDAVAETSNPSPEAEERPSSLNAVAQLARGTDETRRTQTTQDVLSEDSRLDQVVGKTTATDPGITDRLIAGVKRGRAPLSVELDAEGELVWSGELPEGEAGVLAQAQAMVDARLAKWLDGRGGA
jgi:DNA-binding transcriptional ArsR family regulator